MKTFSKDLQNVVSPKFDQDLLIRVLEETYKLKNLKITDIKFNCDSKKGDSYLSIVSRFTVEANYIDEGNGKTNCVVIPIISKAFPSNIGRKKTFRSLDFFENEVIFYNKTWKAMNEFQLSKNSVPVFDRIPTCISAFCDGVHDYVTLEDLSFKGYSCISRNKPLDLDHVHLILKLFAKFHALSLAFKDQQPEKFQHAVEALKETYFSEPLRNWYEKFQRQILFKVLRDAVQKQLAPSYANKLEEILAGDVYGTGIHSCALKGKFNVVTHGDAWVPNFLVNYSDEGTPTTGYMIDFQLARYASPAQDLLFFLYSCVGQSLRVQYWDDLVEFYHTALVEALKSLGSSEKLFTLDDLRSEIKVHAMFGFNMGIEAITMSLLEDDEAVDLDDIQGDEERPLETVWVVHPFKSEEKRQRLADSFKHMVDSGFI